MKKTLTTLGLTAVLGLVAIMQSGCFLVAAGAVAGAAAGTVLYVNGDLEADVNATPEHVVAATKMAMDDLKLPILSSTGASSL